MRSEARIDCECRRQQGHSILNHAYIRHGGIAFRYRSRLDTYWIVLIAVGVIVAAVVAATQGEGFHSDR